MRDRRVFPRHRIEILAEITVPQGKVTGMTHDVSLAGVFVRTTRIPEEGQRLFVTLRLAGGPELSLQGLVVRTLQAPALLRSTMPTGFAMTVAENDSYKRFVSSVAGKDSVASA